MTRLLATVRDAGEAAAALAAGAGGLFVEPPAGIQTIGHSDLGQAAWVATLLHFGVGEDAFGVALDRAAGADRVVIRPDNLHDSSIARLAPHLKRHAAVEASLFVAADGGLRDPPLDLIRAAGFAGILVDLRDSGPAGGLLAHVRMAQLLHLAEACRDRGLDIGFGGGLEPPDVPRLLAARPSMLRFDEALREEGPIAPGRVASIARLAARPGEDFTGRPTDRIFVRDKVVDMEVGAYTHERGRRQRVRFSVEADIYRPMRDVAGMGDVYSYDLITDAVDWLCLRAHVDFVETLAESLARHVLGDPRVAAVTVKVEKLDLGAGAVGIEIRR